MQSFVSGMNSSYQVTPFFDTEALVPLVEEVAPSANRLIDLVSMHYPTFEPTLSLPAEAHQAARMMTMCHTSALGGHVERCPNGHIERLFYNSCGNRFCPRCAARIRQRWLLAREPKLLPVRHYHAIFTLSHTFNGLWNYNFKVMGDLLFHSGVDALKALLADPRWLGAEVGITVTLETWDDQMNFHPHLHCLVTGGGLTPEGNWKDVENPKCLVAVKPLMYEFRKRFCAGLEQLLKDNQLIIPVNSKKSQWRARLRKTNRKNWAVFIAKQPEEGGPTPKEILRYLSKNVAGGPLSDDRLLPSTAELSSTQLAYLKSSPLSETRLEVAPEGMVSFKWGNYNPDTGKRERTEIETLPVAEFMKRYLQHVLPSGYQSVRHFGLYTSAKKSEHDCCVELLSDRIVEASNEKVTSDGPLVDSESWIADHTCPICGKPLVVTAHIPSSLTGNVIERPPLGRVMVDYPPGTG